MTASHKITQFALPYWSNTSSNSIIREMVGEADEMAKDGSGNANGRRHD